MNHIEITELTNQEHSRKTAMIKSLRRRFFRLIGKGIMHFMSCLPVGMELSDGDKAALYSWPDKTISEVTQHE